LEFSRNRRELQIEQSHQSFKSINRRSAQASAGNVLLLNESISYLFKGIRGKAVGGLAVVLD
jgi:hypothetical protein